MTDILPPLVSSGWLAARMGRPGIRIVDGSWHLPGSGRDAASEFVAEHIPGAVFFDLEASSEREAPLPHMLPSAEAFAERMASLGLSDDDDIVVYDASGKNLSAPRVWWMFRVFGHARVAVLDGGLAQWRRDGHPVERGIPVPAPGRFTATLDDSAVRDLAAMRSHLVHPCDQIVDMRSAGRFSGRDPEPRPGMRGGHIPGSLNVPFATLVHDDGTALAGDELRRHLESAGLDLSRDVIATCGSGVTACALVFALHTLGHDRAAVYDGSWSEWGARSDTPVETGNARAVP